MRGIPAARLFQATFRQPWIALLLLLLFTAAIYGKGLNGIFIFDDHENLKALAQLSQLKGDGLLAFALSQPSGVSRILPYLSFALQYDAWPDHPSRMMLVNLLLHLANGVLVFVLASGLADLMKVSRPHRIALATAALWLLNPIQVTSVLYVIQRINEMSAFFVFSGLIAYVHGRKLVADQPRLGLKWIVCGVAFGTVLATLSKENGILLPLLVLVLEITLLRGLAWPARMRYLRPLVVVAPLAVLSALALWQSDMLLVGYAQRNFNLTERLLTECRVLLDYLRAILLLHTSGLGLFHDDYAVVRLPLSWADMLGIAAVAGLMAAGVLMRSKYPVAAFGILWFLAAHVLESTVVPLELYFEHRNYLPLFGPAFALVSLLAAAMGRASGLLRQALPVFGMAWLLLASWVTAEQARLWGSPVALAAVAEYEHPDSVRARTFQAAVLNYEGFRRAAATTMYELTENPGKHTEFYAQWLLLGCHGHLPRLPAFATVAAAYKTVAVSVDVINSLSGIADSMEQGKCPAYRPDEFLPMLDSLDANPAYNRKKFQLLMLRGRFEWLADKVAEALESFRQAYRVSGSPDAALFEVKVLYDQNRYDEAKKRLMEIDAVVRLGGAKSLRYAASVDYWKDKLK
jgi:protein O-mannosyl-transferase